MTKSVAQDVRKDFVELAPIGWKHLRQTFQNLKGELKVRIRAGVEEKDVHLIRFVTGGDSQKIEFHSEVRKSDSVFCRNHYKAHSFSLTEKSGKFFLNELGEYSNNGESLYSIQPDQAKVVRSLFQYLYSPWSFEMYSFPLMMQDDGFQIIDAVSLDSDLVSVDFEFKSKELKRLGVLKNGNAVFSKKNSWGLVRFTGEVVDWGGLSSEIDYVENADGLIYPKTISLCYWDGVPNKSNRGTSYVCNILECETYEASPKEFSLSAFGLPEIDSKEPRSLSSVLTILIGIGLIGICVYLRRQLRKTK